jgi:hypothetical protein
MVREICEMNRISCDAQVASSNHLLSFKEDDHRIVILVTIGIGKIGVIYGVLDE